MKILVLCDEGNNRSVTIAHQLRYLGHDVLTGATRRNDPVTLFMLSTWAERIITTEREQEDAVPEAYLEKIQLWNIGPDRYPRPFNKDLLKLVKRELANHPEYHAR